MNRKKGISAVVATVLIILITVAAVTIIWAAIIPMIKNQISGGTACLDAVSQVSIVSEGYTCVDSTGTGTVKVQISRGAKDFDLEEIQVLISVGGDTYSMKEEASDLGANEEMLITLNASDFDDVSDISGATKVEIAPVVTVGNTQETCDISASAELTECSDAS